MVLNGEIHIAELVYAGQNISVTETAAFFFNERQRVEIGLAKVLEKNELFNIGTNGEMRNISFGLFAAEEIVSAILRDGEHKTKLPGVPIPKEIRFTCDPTCLKEKSVVVFVVPSRFIRSVAQQVKPYLDGDAVLVNASKGLEEETYLTMSQVIQSEYPHHAVGVITGPSHAEEVGRGVPTSVVAASVQEAAALKIQDIFSSSTFRIYINDDPVGCEIGGALKNIIALAAGICDGLKCGDNTKAALMTRGIHEITNLGVKMGGKPETFSGLSGIGDLIVTCCSMTSNGFPFIMEPVSNTSLA